MTELVFPHILQYMGAGVLRELRALRYDHDRKITAALVALANGFCNFVHVKRTLWNQDRVRPARDEPGTHPADGLPDHRR